jgi:hypothetical protein
VTADSIGLDGGVNFYAYVNEDPVNLIDPLGNYSATLPIYRPLPVGPVIGYCLTNPILCTAVGVIVIGIIITNPTDDDASRTLPFPDTRRKMWTCTCRADCDDNKPGNCPEDPDKRYAFGTASGPTFSSAKKAGKRVATHNLKCKPKHIPCNCTGPNGEHRRAQ